MAISAEDHSLYARLNDTYAAGSLEAGILDVLSTRDIETQGYAIGAQTLEANGYLPIHMLTDVDRHNVQHLMLCTRMALGMPAPIKLWSKKEWTYLVGYNGKLFRNIAGFFRAPPTADQKKAGDHGSPSFDHWTAPWHPPGHENHNLFWEEVVSYTDRIGTFLSTNRPRATHLPAGNRGLYVNQDNHVEMTASLITDAELAEYNAMPEGWCGSQKDRLVKVTLESSEAVGWWKGLDITSVTYDADCNPNWGGARQTYNLAVKEDGAPQSVYIPLGLFKYNRGNGSFPPPGGYENDSYLTDFNFRIENWAAVPFSIGETKYSLEDLAGKHLTFTWVTEGSSGNDFDGVPKSYDLHGDQSDIVVSTQTANDGSKAEVTFAINAGIHWWKGIALKKSDGTKLWFTKNDLSGDPDSGFTSTAGLSSTDPVTEWGYHVHVEFWKEVTPGVNYFQKSVKIKTQDLVGYRTTFEWKYDGSNYGPLRTNGYKADGGHDSIALEIEARSPEQVAAETAAYGGYSQIQFKVAPGITWWKAIMLRDVDGSKQILEVQNVPNGIGVGIWRDNITVIQVIPGVIPKGTEVAIEFWKAGFLGIHGYVGEAKINFDTITGKNVTFIWEND